MLLELTDVTVSYGQTPVLFGVNMAINQGDIACLLGRNGVGKTTTIGKLAYQFKKAGYKVVLGAADTFRAAAIDQLQIWADRVGVPIVKQQMGSDPASVAFDTLQSAVTQNADVGQLKTLLSQRQKSAVLSQPHRHL